MTREVNWPEEYREAQERAAAALTDERCAESQKQMAELQFTHSVVGETCDKCERAPFDIEAHRSGGTSCPSAPGWFCMIDHAGWINPCDEHREPPPRLWILDIPAEKYAAWLRERSKEGAFAYSEDELRALLPPKGGFELL